MEKLSLPELFKSYVQTTKRIIILDYDGTLIPIGLRQSEASPSKEVVNILTNLASNPSNRVIVISGREQESLELWPPELGLTLVAEYGGFLKEPGKNWHSFLVEATDWTTKLMSSLTRLVSSHPGSKVEKKEYSISWHYKEIAEKVQQEKKHILAGFHSLPFSKEFSLIDEDYTLEFRTPGIDKGKFISRWLSGFHFDFLLAIGDGESDEDIFRLIDKPNYSVRVGNSSHSHAMFYMDDQREVISLLRQLTELPNNPPPQ